MYRIQKEVELDAGHRVPYHGSKCRNFHGHRYKVIAVVEAVTLVPDTTKATDSGMVMDFGEIKEVLMRCVHDVYDHSMILWEHDRLRDIFEEMCMEDGLVLNLVPCIPTAENLARFWFEAVDEELRRRGVRGFLSRLIVWETPKSMAAFDGRR